MVCRSWFVDHGLSIMVCRSPYELFKLDIDRRLGVVMTSVVQWRSMVSSDKAVASYL